MNNFSSDKLCPCAPGVRERGACRVCGGRGALTTGRRKRRKTTMCPPCQGCGKVCLKCGGYVPRAWGSDA